jgi:uncharacterized repeat protein (TIGR02059 family)
MLFNLLLGVGGTKAADAGSEGPTITNYTPGFGAKVEGTTQGLSIEFDNPVQKGQGYIYVKRASDNAEFLALDVQDNAVNVNEKVVSWQVGNQKALTPGERYYVLIDQGAFLSDDSEKNPFSGISSAEGWYFNVKGDQVSLKSMVPTKDATGVAINTSVQLDFSRPVYPNQGDISVQSAASGTQNIPINVLSSNVTGGGTSRITITLPDLTYNTKYTISVPKGAFKDTDSNEVGTQSWSFTTASAASSTLSMTPTPSDRSTNVSVNTNIIATFNNNIKLVDKSKILLKKQGNTAVDATLDYSGKQLIIKPTAKLQEGTTYYVDIAAGAIEDAVSGAKFAGIDGAKNWTFQTAVTDKTAPVLQNATMYTNSVIRLQYNKSLDSSINLLTSNFTVTVNGENRRITNAYISGDSVYVTLEIGVAVGQNVKVTYSGNTVRPIQDLSGNAASTFSNKEVMNGVDSVLPKPEDGSVTGSTLTLYFSDSLKSVSTYAYEQFTVTTNGYSKGIDRIYQSGRTVTLYLSSSVSNGDVVKVSYSPGSYPLQDYRGQNIPAFSDYFVRNTYDTIPPEFIGAEGSGNKVVLTYNEALRTSNVPMKSQFSVLVNNTPIYVTNVEIKSSQVILTLASSFTKDQSVTVSYVSGAGGIADLNGNLAGYIDLYPVTYNMVAEGIRSASVRGDTITILYNTNLRAVSSFPVNQFYVSTDKVGVNIQSVTVSGDTVTIKLSSSVLASQTVEVSYMSGATVLYDNAGNMMKGYSAMQVTNLTSGGTTTPGTGGQPSYLTTLASGEFGVNGYVMGKNTAQSSSDRSRAGQSINKYTVDSAKLKESLAFTTGAQRLLAFEVPTSERAASVVIPMSPLTEIYTMGKKGSIAVKYGDILYTLPLEKLPFSDISRAAGTGSYSGVNLIIRLESLPAVKPSTPVSKSGVTVSALGDPIEIYVAATNSAGAIENEVTTQGQLYMRSNKQGDTKSASLMRYDLTTRSTAYTPSAAQMFGSGILLTGKISGNMIVGPVLGYSYFSDTSKHWAVNDISELASKLIVEPRANSGMKFEPDKNITRAEFAMFIAKGLGLAKDESSARRFPDVIAGSEVGGYIGAAAKAGIINGNSDGTFKPNSNISREQMALMMVRAMEYAGYDVANTGTQVLAKFKDAAKIQNKQTVSKAVQEGIIQGMTSTTFQPQGTATRAQAAVMLKRVLDKLNQ